VLHLPHGVTGLSQASVHGGGNQLGYP